MSRGRSESRADNVLEDPSPAGRLKVAPLDGYATIDPTAGHP